MKDIPVLLKTLFCMILVIGTGVFNPIAGLVVAIALTSIVIKFEKELF